MKTEIVGESGIRYSYRELCDRLLELQLPTPVPQAPNITPQAEVALKPQRYKDITVPVAALISLECALGKSKEFLGGVATLRNTSMATLARDLIGVQTEFAQLGQGTNVDILTDLKAQ